MTELRGWRLLKTKYRAAPFDGTGAARFGGRWNHKGVPVVYAGICASLTIIEVFVYTSIDWLSNMSFSIVSFTLNIPEYTQINRYDLPDEWSQSPTPEFTKDIGTTWFREGKTPVLIVPSSIVPQDKAIVLNPAHPDIKIVDWNIEAFVFNPRML